MNPTPDRIPLPNPPPAAGEGRVGDDEDPRLVRAAQEYLAELEAGRRPDRGEFVARFPGLAEQLAPYLDALDMVHGSGPAAPRAPARPAVDVPPVEALGDFHIVREIGRGGMGVVYEAVQLSLGRRVALKVLPFAAALDARQLQRFKNEAQAAAQLHHTNIVPVYAVGCERGTHYYAMQLIEGQDLAGLIGTLRAAGGVGGVTGSYRPTSSEVDYRRPDAIRRVDGTAGTNAAPPAAATVHAPAAELTTHHSSRSARFYQTAARLAAQAADALEHAHEFGVIHRDVKPANLIVDERGNVWVTDFGLAQFNADAGLTQTGALLGTLRYMSPEQAGGQRVVLDHRTDVYSLGATLYELLTLRPIFEGDNRPALLRQIAADEPPRPRSIDRSMPTELETIVLKALAKSPADRYATAREFGDDLRRFLDHRPIQARPPTLTQRARKWARRNPTLVGAAVALCVLTALGSLVSAAMIRQAYEQERKRADQAEEALKLARQSADEMIEISETELAGKPGMEELRKRMLLSGLVYYQGLIAQCGDDPNARADLAAAQAHVNKILADLAVLQGGGRADLLNRDDVKDDLALTGEQRTQLDDLHRSLDRQRMGGGAAFLRMTPERRQQKALDEARTKEAAVDNLLTPQQQGRLKQIALQLKPGLSAFHDPDVAEDLKLTAAQKDSLRAVEADSFFPRLDPWRGPGKGPEPGFHLWSLVTDRLFAGRRGPGKGPEPGFRSPREKFLALLTEEQKQRWKELTGEPFQESPHPFGQFPPGFGPGGPEPHGPPPGRVAQPPGPPG